MGKAIEGKIRRPTEDAAFGLCMDVKPKLDIRVLEMEFTDVDLRQWHIRLFHTHLHLKWSTLFQEWLRCRPLGIDRLVDYVLLYNLAHTLVEIGEVNLGKVKT